MGHKSKIRFVLTLVAKAGLLLANLPKSGNGEAKDQKIKEKTFKPVLHASGNRD